MSFWPAGAAGALSLTFDDGMRSQLEFALPQLNARKLRATFYLNPADQEEGGQQVPWRERLERWLPAHQQGHEMGNHSIGHPCSLNVNASWAPHNLLRMTLADIATDLDEAQRRLEQVFPAQKATSFAYPCYESTIGQGIRRASYVPLVARRFVAARARGELRGELANDPLYCDLHHLSSWNVERQAAAFLIGLAEQAAVHGLWGIYTFHGIQEGHLAVTDVDFVDFLDHLARRSAALWVAPVAEVAEYIRSAQKAG